MMLGVASTRTNAASQGLRRLAVGHGIDEAAPRRVGGGEVPEVEHVRAELFDG